MEVSYEVFNQRPIPEDIIAYCVGDAQYLPELRDKYWKPTPSFGGDDSSTTKPKNGLRILENQTINLMAKAKRLPLGASITMRIPISGMVRQLFAITLTRNSLI